jgi:hypothetical protein
MTSGGKGGGVQWTGERRTLLPRSCARSAPALRGARRLSLASRPWAGDFRKLSCRAAIRSMTRPRVRDRLTPRERLCRLSFAKTPSVRQEADLSALIRTISELDDHPRAPPAAARWRRCAFAPTIFRRQGWLAPQTRQIPDWCGCSTEYLPVPEGDNCWSRVPIWDPAQMPNPLRPWELAGAFWAADP